MLEHVDGANIADWDGVLHPQTGREAVNAQFKIQECFLGFGAMPANGVWMGRIFDNYGFDQVAGRGV